MLSLLEIQIWNQWLLQYLNQLWAEVIMSGPDYLRLLLPSVIFNEPCAGEGGNCVIFLDLVSMNPFLDVLNTGQHNTQTFRQKQSPSGCAGWIRLNAALPVIPLCDWLKLSTVDLISCSKA